ncbi:ATPase, T2SS/T4P/T4SS family [Helicobacter cetorum]|uniref:Type IV secretion system protein VirB11 n=1 Tax=Helicobacter cetorum (strain ATCC BAA-540 / CCUG 52418 / MIT 99-5656) TaxID=1163745 RepID=I0EU96_HELCM|nr:ATPase, T2SS/T4P/T4SS family [Helicobacter cetorum]AFI06515.1 type IV secretion system protein VirB11 [Helicobacter cetorum MIT 99-5656]
MAISAILEVLISKLRPYLELDINEVIFNEPYKFYLVRGSSYELLENKAFDEKFLMNFCEQLATHRNLFFNHNFPHLACSIPFTRYRVNALHPSVTANNSISICIRVPSNFKFKINAFVLGQKCQEKGIDYAFILNLVRLGKNILVSGGTASGKTSFVNSLIEEIPITQRVITVEDSPELHLKNPNQVNVVVGKNEDSNFTYENALNSAMRMSPERVLLGEIDTRNTALFLRLSNTGHSGMISTLHANSVVEAFNAIGMNVKMNAGKDIDTSTLLDFFIAGMDFIIQIVKKGNERIIEDVLDVKKELRLALNRE